MAPQSALVELFADFIRLRQVGYAPEAAWQALRPRIAKLDDQDIARLHSLLRGWEAREGRHYQVAGSLNATPEHPGDRIERVRTSMASLNNQVNGQSVPPRPQTIPVEPDESYVQKKHLIRRIAGTPEPPAPPTPPSPEGLCPVCGQVNRVGELYCVHCGYLLAGTGEDAALLGQTRPVSQAAIQGSNYGPGMVIQIKVRGGTEPIRVAPQEGKELILGRASADSLVMPDVDLTPFSAQSYGVSRLHAALTWQGGSIILRDMGSLNYTFINGQRLHTNEQRVVSDGDEIRLGHLAMHIYFRDAG